MRVRTAQTYLLLVLIGGWTLAARAADPPGDVDFVRDIQPLFAAHCADCHAGDSRESGLRLDRRRDALAGGDSGKVILPGKPDESLLVKYVTGADPEKVMPPEGDRLSADQIFLLKSWIAQGANWPDAAAGPVDAAADHWAYRPVVRCDPPAVADTALVRNSIDAFVQARLEAQGIAPSPEADRYTLIKRLYYDLLGLPPEPAAVDQFVHDTSEAAYEHLVDELLRSPHFGERWGRHWLDTARYADSDGYEKDNPRYNAWRYRDWVIQAVNDDLPFDQFTIQQLAGDLLPEATGNQRLATAFNRQTLTNTEGGTDQEQWRVEAVFDRVETLGTAWLGLTIGCARCHTHKYDAISQREYYQFFAFFNNGDEATTTIPTSSESIEQYRAKKTAFDAQLADIQKPVDAARQALAPKLVEWEEQQQQRLADLAARPAEFHSLPPTSIRSDGGATLTVEENGSVLAGGERPLKDVYVFEATLDRNDVTAIRLEVLAHDALPARGPGRADHGNFVLSEISCTVRVGDAEPRPLAFSTARADFSQNSFDPRQAIDGKEDSTGWAIAGQLSKDHHAIFYFADEARSQLSTLHSPLVLTIRLSQQYDKSPHTIGCFRLTAMTGVDAESLGLPENVRKLLAIATDQRSDAQRNELLGYFASLDPAVRELQAQVDEFRKQEPFKPEMAVPVLQERAQDRRTTKMFRRGDFLQPLDEVSPDTLGVLPALVPHNSETPPGRLDLARWLVSPENPLTPRVVVNHVWSHHFGRGLVKTVNDFGVRGDPPTHPELLDWLASEFVRLDWSRKALIKTIVMSHTYRQSSQHRPELVDVDPENTRLYRQNRIRVEAEIVRDLHLAASGLLERRIGGPSVFPPLPPGIAEQSYANNFKWGNSDWNTRPDRPWGIAPNDDVYRRGMYTFFKRTAPHPSLTTFDCPDANTTSVQRSTSNTPLQALITLNNGTFVDAARALSRRVLAEVNTNDAERLTRMVRLCVARPPTADELNEFLDLLSAAREYYSAKPDEAQSFAGDKLPPETTVADAAAWTATARIVMNVDEFITRE
jgi:mono/diheme cytochrome c family protein